LLLRSNEELHFKWACVLGVGGSSVVGMYEIYECGVRKRISIDGKCFICMSVAGDPSPTFRRPGERDYPSSSESQIYFTAYDIRMPNLLY
jgi:hypothetical protein